MNNFLHPIKYLTTESGVKVQKNSCYIIKLVDTISSIFYIANEYYL